MLEEIRKIKPQLPVKVGMSCLPNILETGINIIATRNLFVRGCPDCLFLTTNHTKRHEFFYMVVALSDGIASVRSPAFRLLCILPRNFPYFDKTLFA